VTADIPIAIRGGIITIQIKAAFRAIIPFTA
jgi:hypothetical protein